MNTPPPPPRGNGHVHKWIVAGNFTTPRTGDRPGTTTLTRGTVETAVLPKGEGEVSHNNAVRTDRLVVRIVSTCPRELSLLLLCWRHGPARAHGKPFCVYCSNVSAFWTTRRNTLVRREIAKTRYYFQRVQLNTDIRRQCAVKSAFTG